MENCDRELILSLMTTDTELRRLYQRHLELEEHLDGIRSRLFLTADEQMQTKRWKPPLPRLITC